jgi:hypothetical protein
LVRKIILNLKNSFLSALDMGVRRGQRCLPNAQRIVCFLHRSMKIANLAVAGA